MEEDAFVDPPGVPVGRGVGLKICMSLLERPRSPLDERRKLLVSRARYCAESRYCADQRRLVGTDERVTGGEGDGDEGTGEKDGGEKV